MGRKKLSEIAKPFMADGTEQPIVPQNYVDSVKMPRDLVQAPEEVVSAVILTGDLSKLSEIQKVQYYNAYCSRVGLDPVTKPFDLITLNGKQIMYASRSCAQQLNKLHHVSHEVKSRDIVGDAIYTVTCRASLPDGRFTDSIGAVSILGLKGNDMANAVMKCETKSKRRATLDLLGLGILDESELDTIANARPVPMSSPVPAQIPTEKTNKYKWEDVSLDFSVPEGDFKGKKIGDLLTKQMEYLATLCDNDTSDKILLLVDDRINAGYHKHCSEHKEYEVIDGFDTLPVPERKKIMTGLGFNFK